MSIEDQAYEAAARGAANAAHDASESLRRTLEQRIEWLEACVLVLAAQNGFSRKELYERAKSVKQMLKS